MPPFVFPTVIPPLRATAFAWGNDGLNTLLCQFLNQPVCIKGFVGWQCTKAFILNQCSDAANVVALSGQQYEIAQIAQSIGQGRDFGRYPAFGSADCLFERPPFAP